MIGTRRRTDQLTNSTGIFFAWCFVLLSIALVLVYIYFWYVNGRLTPFNGELLGIIGFAFAGALMISRNIGNIAGWVAIGMAIAYIVTDSAFEYSYYALITQPGSLPLGGFCSWLTTWIWGLVYPCLTALFLLFPTGRATSRIWWLVIGGSIATTLPMLITNMISTWPYRGAAILLADMAPKPNDILQFAQNSYLVWAPFVIMFITLALMGMILRFINSTGQERQQIKLIALASTLLPLSLSVSVIASFINDPIFSYVSRVINLLSILAFPVAMVIAIRRYHLFDIDFLIRRTLVYSSLTLLLAVIYLAAILLFQEIFTSIFGQQSQVGIVLSTLLIAAVSQPLRTRIQQAIDRRFYRQKYNAEATFERFSAGLRDEVNLEDLTDRLQVAVEETVQPSSISLWLISDPEIKRGDERG